MAGAASHPLLAAPEPGRARHRALPRCRALRSFPCYGGEGGAGQRQRDPEADAPLEGCRRAQPQEQMALQSRRAPRVRRRVRTQAGPSLTAVPRSATGADGANTQPPAPDGDDGARAPGPPIPASPRLTGFRVKTPCCTHVVGPFTWTGQWHHRPHRHEACPHAVFSPVLGAAPSCSATLGDGSNGEITSRKKPNAQACENRSTDRMARGPPCPASAGNGGTGRRRLGVSPRSALALQRPHTRPEHGVWGYGSFSRVVSEFINLESE